MKKFLLGLVMACACGLSMGQTTAALDQTQGQKQDALAQASNAGNTQVIQNIGSEKQDVHYGGEYTVKNVPSVSGPNLTTSNDTCMGSTSGSANAAGIGIGFGSTWTDEHCKNLKSSRELWNKGMKAASLAMDCMNPSAKAALEMTGTKCPQSMTAEERRTIYGDNASTAFAQVEVPAEFQSLKLTKTMAVPVVKYTDPYIAARMANK